MNTPVQQEAWEKDAKIRKFKITVTQKHSHSTLMEVEERIYDKWPGTDKSRIIWVRTPLDRMVLPLDDQPRSHNGLAVSAPLYWSPISVEDFTGDVADARRRCEAGFVKYWSDPKLTTEPKPSGMDGLTSSDA